MYIVITVICILLMLTGTLYVVYRMAFYTDRDHHPKPDSMPPGEQYAPFAERLIESVRRLEKVPFEPVEIISHDGLKLFGRWYSAGKKAPVAIFFHGYKSTAIRDASGGAPFCMERGFNVLLVDQRSHGNSEGRSITFGVKERRDCLSWIEYVIGRAGKDTEIILMGVSMGAATVMMAADLCFPENVKGIAADCGYSSPEEIIVKVAGDMKLPGIAVKPAARMAARIFAGFDLRESDAIRAVKKLKVPAILIHGDDDRFVPCKMSRRIQMANPEKVDLVVIQNAGHGIAYYVDTKAYKKAMGKICDLCSANN